MVNQQSRVLEIQRCTNTVVEASFHEDIISSVTVFQPVLTDSSLLPGQH